MQDKTEKRKEEFKNNHGSMVTHQNILRNWWQGRKVACGKQITNKVVGVLDTTGGGLAPRMWEAGGAV